MMRVAFLSGNGVIYDFRGFARNSQTLGSWGPGRSPDAYDTQIEIEASRLTGEIDKITLIDINTGEMLQKRFRITKIN